jgi:hypothetical protein
VRVNAHIRSVRRKGRKEKREAQRNTEAGKVQGFVTVDPVTRTHSGGILDDRPHRCEPADLPLPLRVREVA